VTLAKYGRAANDLANDLYADEVSSIRCITPLDLKLGVEVDAFAADRPHGSPTPVYARPYSLIDGERRDNPRAYYLGTRFALGIIASATWEDDMRADGASDFVVAKCRRYLRDNAF
jgi:hypothetical protein